MKEVSVDSESIVPTDESNGVSRRRFIGRVGAAVGAIGVAPLLGGSESTAEGRSRRQWRKQYWPEAHE
jgi:hypothetical protein